MMKYAAFEYSNGRNIGDTIQTIAAQKYLPRTDLFIDRDTIDNLPFTDETLYISNGCCDSLPVFPIHQSKAHPLYIAVHLHHPKMINPQLVAHLRQHGPIGCRDQHTYELLQSHNIPSYYSSCLTITLDRPIAPKTNTILIVDVHKTLLPMIPLSLRENAQYITHTINEEMPLAERITRAHQLLTLYASARLVITGRLHCALPCVAMNTPVVLLHENPDDSRLETARRFIPVYAYGDKINWQPTPPDIAVTRESLQKLCYQAITKHYIQESVKSQLVIPHGYTKTNTLQYVLYKNMRQLYKNIPQKLRVKMKLNPAH